MGGTTFLLTEERIALKNWRSGFLLRPGSNVFVSEYFKDLRCDFKNVTPNNITQVLVKHHKLPLFWTWASRLDTLLVRNSLKISKKRMFGLNSSFVHKHKTQPLNQRSVTFPHHSSLFWKKIKKITSSFWVLLLGYPPHPPFFHHTLNFNGYARKQFLQVFVQNFKFFSHTQSSTPATHALFWQGYRFYYTACSTHVGDFYAFSAFALIFQFLRLFSGFRLFSACI